MTAEQVLHSKSFNDVLDFYSRKVWRAQPHRCELADIRQELLIQWWKAIPKFDEKRGSLSTYSSMVVKCRAANLYPNRLRKYPYTVSYDGSLENVLFNNSDRLDKDISVDVLLTRMSKRHQQVLSLVREGWTPAQIAGRMGVTRQAVHDNIERIREKMAR